MHAAGTGAVLTLLSMPPQDRDPPDLADAMFDAVMQPEDPLVYGGEVLHAI